MDDDTPSVNVSANDVLAWIKFNRPEVLREAIDAVAQANLELAGPEKKPKKAPAKKAVKKTGRTGGGKKR